MKIIPKRKLRELLINRDLLNAILDNFEIPEMLKFIEDFKSDKEYILHRMQEYQDYSEKESDNYNYD